jgi:hypothetical protein
MTDSELATLEMQVAKRQRDNLMQPNGRAHPYSAMRGRFHEQCSEYLSLIKAVRLSRLDPKQVFYVPPGVLDG